MKLLLFIINFIIILLRASLPGGIRRVAAENMAMRQQLVSVTRKLKRAPKQNAQERITFGFLTSLIIPKRLARIAIAIKPSSLLKFHRALVKRKYRLLFSNKIKRKPGPKGPSIDLINAIIEMKRRNPRFGTTRIATQISIAFGIEIDKDMVRRVLSKYFTGFSSNPGPSWLTSVT